jgi:hypothetical protein
MQENKFFQSEINEDFDNLILNMEIWKVTKIWIQ